MTVLIVRADLFGDSWLLATLSCRLHERPLTCLLRQDFQLTQQLVERAPLFGRQGHEFGKLPTEILYTFPTGGGFRVLLLHHATTHYGHSAASMQAAIQGGTREDARNRCARATFSSDGR
jgi:hypothetical protein